MRNWLHRNLWHDTGWEGDLLVLIVLLVGMAWVVAGSGK